MGLGATIKNLLSQKGMSIKELSEKTDIPLNTLYSITKRDSSNIHIDNLKKIAVALNVDVDFLIGWEKNRSVEENLNASPIAAKIISETINDKMKDKIFKISFDTTEYTPEELLKILEFAQFLKSLKTKF